MPSRPTTKREAAVLRFIYEQFKDKPIVGVSDVAKFLGISPASAFEIINRIVKKELLTRIKRRGYVLTKSGLSEAEKLVFIHRVLEYVFFKVFGMSPENACKLAAQIDYLVEVHNANKAFESLECPTHCPCNKEIPRIKLVAANER
ncbi:MAG: metal-dependent transcriptional regulator [Crenarchaeota archaeon]|nr:metal-dependent transcriptional regulator [Thermoproteota archaeon]MCR8454109.1 metal-dependent transcriptional regulator [Thermoproteota archaeon]MCR8455403.1 metal-dependent transcriptional regulator [Thermoproteota archaeon]MCR8471244.1 metal-dependent transcriptional regulator [Thermoproteota archaeon]MCR8472356.1 metal-dependent transcriptional regulator [Thermoproteota archaeon]